MGCGDVALRLGRMAGVSGPETSPSSTLTGRSRGEAFPAALAQSATCATRRCVTSAASANGGKCLAPTSPSRTHVARHDSEYGKLCRHLLELGQRRILMNGQM